MSSTAKIAFDLLVLLFVALCRFVTDPHGGDASFQRIGRLLKAAKKDRGL
jgi:hypothetical protein